MSRRLGHLCCKAKDQPQKYVGDRLHLRESGVSPRMQVQQYSKHRGLVRWSTQNICWDGQKYCFSLPWSFSGDTTSFSRSARIGSTSMPSSQTGTAGWHKSFKSSLWWVVGTDSASSSTSEKFSRAHQLVSSNQFPSEGTVIGLFMAHQSYLHCMTFWEFLIF